MLEILEEQLPLAVEQPPDVVEVMRYLVPAPDVEVVEERAGQVRGKKREQRKGRRRDPTAADQEAVRQRRQAMWAKPGWEVMLKSRMKLPAWTERERIMTLLETNRVLIVVGEVGWLTRLIRPAADLCE
jgi:ATP-dependent RNA helicase DHX57